MKKFRKGKKRKAVRESSISDDDDDDLVRGSTRRGETKSSSAITGLSRLKKLKRERKEYALVIAEDETDATRTISWQSLNAGPSELPLRQFCCICGFPAPQRCRACLSNKPHSYVRFLCSVRCANVHTDTDCCKPRQWLTW